MDSKTAQTLSDDVAIAGLLGAVTFMGLSAVVSELAHAGLLSRHARIRIRNFIKLGVDEADVPERTKAYVRSMVRSHFPSA